MKNKDNKINNLVKDIKSKNPYIIYTDGGYDNETKTCSSAFLILKHNRLVEEYAEGYSAKTSTWNIEAEINAVHKALDYCEKNKINIILFICDLMNCVNHINGVWKGKQQQSIDLYTRCRDLKFKGFQIVAKHVKGHSGNYYNERVDYLCSLHLNQK